MQVQKELPSLDPLPLRRQLHLAHIIVKVVGQVVHLPITVAPAELDHHVVRVLHAARVLVHQDHLFAPTGHLDRANGTAHGTQGEDLASRVLVVVDRPVLAGPSIQVVTRIGPHPTVRLGDARALLARLVGPAIDVPQALRLGLRETTDPLVHVLQVLGAIRRPVPIAIPLLAGEGGVFANALQRVPDRHGLSRGVRDPSRDAALVGHPLPQRELLHLGKVLGNGLANSAGLLLRRGDLRGERNACAHPPFVDADRVADRDAHARRLGVFLEGLVVLLVDVAREAIARPE
mmetsp:Transcript_40669/g.94194  ORF Transcript_40669/g.94194 Transcript_40669/m.94194 type:complete len:290 (-) Transcript_40669:1560-2429(-)